ncbi:MAG: hypothetical protein EBZ47_03255 [Chlamydiae bacterium]|nr:hypothetical protein [Chlamydiota bacterium]
MSFCTNYFAIANQFTPLFNTPKIQETFGGMDGVSLPLQGELLKELETMIFPNTPLKILKKHSNYICEVSCHEYPSLFPLFTDIRFLDLLSEPPPKRNIILPSVEEIKNTCISFLGVPYLWGGSSRGIKNMLELYPPHRSPSSLPSLISRTWSLEGVDCSGLIYYATNGWTPRNTSSLIQYGRAVSIYNKDISLWDIQPLDLIVWKGHVILILDQNTTIESLGGKGVISYSFKDRIEQIHKEYGRYGVNHWNQAVSLREDQRFVIRRWLDG